MGVSIVVSKPRHLYQDFNEGEVEFICAHTKGAEPGCRRTAKELALLPEMHRHTWQSIATIIKKNGYADPVRSQAIKAGKKAVFSKDIEKEALVFLKNTARFWPTSVVSRHLSISETRLKRLRRMSSLTFTHTEAKADPVYKKWWKKREKKRVTNLRKAFKNRPEERQKELEAKLSLLLDDVHQVIKWKKCVSCGKLLPNTDVFFRLRRRKSVGKGVYYVFTNLCVSCPSGKRR